MSFRSLLIFIVCVVVVGGTVLILSHYAEMRSSVTQSSLENSILYGEAGALTAQISTTSPTISSASSASTSVKVILPILVYHIVRPSHPSDSAAVRAIALTPETFDAEMNYLQSAGYHVVRFSDLEAYFANGASLPSKPIIISFDDGWKDQFKYAFPILEKYRYPATFFVFTNAIGNKGFLAWSDLREFISAGMTVGDHSRSHPYLARITSTSTLWDEINGSKLLLEEQLGVPINEFAYPFGSYNAVIVSLVQEAGYKSARTDSYDNSGKQSTDRLFELSAMNAPTTTARFEEIVPAK